MGYDEDLAARLRELLEGTDRVTEKRMFGGLAFLVDGHMAVAASGKGGLMVRVAPEDTDALRAKEHVGPFVMKDRELDGWVRVAPEGCRTKRQLEPWVRRGVAFVTTLPPK